MAPPGSGRLVFLDALRGVALVAMVLNHTARWWLGPEMGWPRYHLIYLTVTVAAPAFLVLVGFSLPLAGDAARRRGERASGWRQARRGAGLILTGWALTLLVFPREPLLSGGVLQTIGLAIIVLAPVAPRLGAPAVRRLLVALAAALYASFAWGSARLGAWLAGHRMLADVWFFDFPLWPWIAASALGAVAGSAWIERRRAGRDPAREVTSVAAVAVACLTAFLVVELAVGPAPHLAFKRDIILNRHWTPGPVTLLWIGGLLGSLFAAAWLACEARGWRAGWLVALGRQALPLYVVH